MLDVFVFDLQEIMCTFLGSRKRMKGKNIDWDMHIKCIYTNLSKYLLIPSSHNLLKKTTQWHFPRLIFSLPLLPSQITKLKGQSTTTCKQAFQSWLSGWFDHSFISNTLQLTIYCVWCPELWIDSETQSPPEKVNYIYLRKLYLFEALGTKLFTASPEF